MSPKLLVLLAAAFISKTAKATNLNVYDPVPGLDPSPYYDIRVREKGKDHWIKTFPMITECTDAKHCTSHKVIADHLKNWSNTYINIEMRDGVDIEFKITMLFGNETISKAVVHPNAAAQDCNWEDGNAYVTINKPGLFAVDINGQMDDQDTGKMPKTRQTYDGPPIHTVTIFANPFIDDKPSLKDDGVYKVIPGQVPPSIGEWHTLYFLPGQHDLGISFPLHCNKSYYIPGDAVVYATLNNGRDFKDGHHIHIFGHGTLSGEKYPHPQDEIPPLDKDQYWTYSPIVIKWAYNVKIEGITIINSAYHSVQTDALYDPSNPTDIKWIKVFTWRPNGDGIGLHDNGLVEDCFVRTQDDSFYVTGRAMRRNVIWNDSNGSAWVFNHIGQPAMNIHDVAIEDCTVIYSRAHMNNGPGQSVFNMRSKGEGEGGYTVYFKNIRVEDPRPTNQQFKIFMESLEPYGPNSKRGPGDLHGIIFENITIVAPSVLDEPDILWGSEEAMIYGLQFYNVKIGNERVEGIDHFLHNEYVFDNKPPF